MHVPSLLRKNFSKKHLCTFVVSKIFYIVVAIVIYYYLVKTVWLLFCDTFRSPKSAQTGDSSDTSGNSGGESTCSSSSSASSVQTQINSSKGASINNESASNHNCGDVLPDTPRHLLELGVSLSSPDLLHSSAALTTSSSGSDSDVSYYLALNLKLMGVLW